MTAIFPSLANKSKPCSRALVSWGSSLFTSMRNAWKVCLAG
ncbi:hypothetical protein EVA_13514 [gut metagenome]|uniref:Uncharacterized protein n=1 Tax=gut metagenome TaxID=749906 RepID=J9FV42_9ZZZZ